MRYLELSPPPELAALVHRIWFLETDRSAPDGEPILPDGRPELIFHLGEPFALETAHGGEERQTDALFAGQLVSPLRVRSSAGGDVVGIRLRPEAAPALTGESADRMTGRVPPLADLARGISRELLGLLRRAVGPDARVEAIARVLGGLSRGPSQLVASAVRAIERTPTVAVAALARSLACSERTLERRFRAEVGVSPRTLGRIVRFRRAVRMIGGREDTLARVAARAGYADQAHLAREFRRLAGRPPSSFVEERAELGRALATGGPKDGGG
ncbi:MAG: AraC family transcriptional regulator [Gemmatimonadales bacterium]